MKDTGFLALLKDRDYKPINAGFMKDKEDRRGASASVKLGGKRYAIWFIQRDFPTGIYACAVTTLKACVIWPVFEYIETRDMFELIEFVDNLKNGVDEDKPFNFTHPWTELSNRIMDV
jgi:hypothetical protein